MWNNTSGMSHFSLMTHSYGWTKAAIRKYADLIRPRFEIKNLFRQIPSVPSRSNKSLRLRDLLPLGVKYPNISSMGEIDIPDDFLYSACTALRKNLELAALLETEIGYYGMEIAPIIPDDNEFYSNPSRSHDLSGHVLSFTSFFERLVVYNSGSAKLEFNKWDIKDDVIFACLRMWAAGLDKFLSATEAAEVFLALSDAAFWERRHQRDLLLALAKRWDSFTCELKNVIEQKLLKGCPKGNNETEEDYNECKVARILERLTWLAEQGCVFSSISDIMIEELKKQTPKWKDAYTKTAVNSLEARSGVITTDTDYAMLLGIPLDDVLDKAKEISDNRENFLLEKNPFLGLCTEQPEKALDVLENDFVKHGKFRTRAWETFFDCQARENDDVELFENIAEKVLGYPNNNLSTIIGDLTLWLSKTLEKLEGCSQELLDKLFAKFITILKSNATLCKSDNSLRISESAVNSPVGYLSKALLQVSIDENKRLCSSWLQYIDALLETNSPTRKYALAYFSRNLDWFYANIPDWAEFNLISVLRGDHNSEYDAAWDGFLYLGRLHSRDLYMKLKSELMRLAINDKDDGHIRVLANIILVGWYSINEDTGISCTSDNEIRDILLKATENYRIYSLECFRYWLHKNRDKTQSWYKLMPKFLSEIWPKQKYIKTAKITGCLCDIAFADEERFPEIVDIILKLVSKIDNNWGPFSPDRAFEKFPEISLNLLFTILPNNARHWPYQVSYFLTQIEQADSSLKNDSKLIELKRRWNAL